MRILFLSNFYAPAVMGGWEQLCQETVDALLSRGHQVTVLTSRYGIEGIQQPEPHVHRSLFLESDLAHYNPLDFFLRLPWQDRYNYRYLKRLVSQMQPDIIFIWGMWQLNTQLAVLAEQLCPGRVAYYMCGYWPIELDMHTIFWQTPEDKRWVHAVKRLIAYPCTRIIAWQRRKRPRLQYVTCVSQAVLDILRDNALELRDAFVIYNGIKLEQFYRPLESDKFLLDNRPLRLLYAGSIIPAKGADRAIQAMASLAQKFGPDVLHLTIVGSGHPDFENLLRRLVREHHIEAYVSFRSRVPRDEMPRLVQNFDVLLFTSTYQEPLARMMMEAMAAGLVLVSTTTGGSKEFLEHAHNSLTFQAGDAEDLARQIERLLNEPGLMRQLALAGQQTAFEKFDFGRMVDEMEAFLEDIFSRAQVA